MPTKTESAISAFLASAGYRETGGGNNFTSYARKGRELYVFVTDEGPNANDDSHFIEIDPESGAPIGAGFFFSESEGEEDICAATKARLG